MYVVSLLLLLRGSVVQKHVNVVQSYIQRYDYKPNTQNAQKQKSVCLPLYIYLLLHKFSTRCVCLSIIMQYVCADRILIFNNYSKKF